MGTPSEPTLTEPSRERFLSKTMAVWLTAYGFFALSFASFGIRGDGETYFNLLRRFFGEHPDFAFAYQFGSDFWNWPFFLAGKGLGAIFGLEPKTFHVTFEELSITLATNVAFIVILYLTWQLLRDLGLPHTPAILFVTTFGSPLFFYVVFDPAGKHAVDTLVLTAATLLVLRLFRNPRDGTAIALGALAAVSLNTRWINVAFFAAILVGLWVSNRRVALIGSATTIVLAPVLYGIPALRGISYFVPSYFPKSSTAAGAHPVVGGVANPLNGFNPLIPLKMLFSIHRGLFVWTPLTAIAVVGFVLLLRRERDPIRRRLLRTLGAASLCLLLAHVIWGQWDGGFAFSQRFLTGLFPLYAIGIAELVRRVGALLYIPLALCVVWALMLAFVHVIGYQGISQADGADQSVHALAHNFGVMHHRWNLRWQNRWKYLWNLPQGRDPQHVHG
jgi:hypothetical protein